MCINFALAKGGSRRAAILLQTTRCVSALGSTGSRAEPSSHPIYTALPQIQRMDCSGQNPFSAWDNLQWKQSPGIPRKTQEPSYLQDFLGWDLGLLEYKRELPLIYTVLGLLPSGPSFAGLQNFYHLSIVGKKTIPAAGMSLQSIAANRSLCEAMGLERGCQCLLCRNRTLSVFSQVLQIQQGCPAPFLPSTKCFLCAGDIMSANGL